MKKLSNKLGAFGSAAVLLFLACGIVSDTWVISFKVVENKDLVWHDNFYYSEVDMSEASDWNDHKEHLKDVDLVGFELWATNSSSSNKTYRVYAVPGSNSLDSNSTRAEVIDGATLILEDIPLEHGKLTYITYGKSFTYLKNFGKLVTYAESGHIKFFSMEANEADSTDVRVDSILVVVTFTAGL